MKAIATRGILHILAVIKGKRRNKTYLICLEFKFSSKFNERLTTGRIGEISSALL